MSSVLCLIIAILSSASVAVVLKIFWEQKGNRYGIILGNYLTCVILSFVMAEDKSAVLHIEGITWISGIIAGILFVAGLVGMQESIRINGAILTSAFSKLGLIVPLLISAVIFGDKIRILQIIGIIIVLIAFLLISTDPENNADKDEKHKVYPLLLLAVLLFCGGADAMAKIFEQIGERAQDGNYFLILFATAALLAAVLLLIERKKTGKKIILKEFAAGVLVGIPNYFSSALLLGALKGLPASVAYPCFSAGTLLIVTLIGTFFFREWPGKRTWTGLGLIAAVLTILNI